jgi:hypothetical protein
MVLKRLRSARAGKPCEACLDVGIAPRKISVAGERLGSHSEVQRFRVEFQHRLPRASDGAAGVKDAERLVEGVA